MRLAFTIATTKYLAAAKVLCDSFCENNPDYLFFIVLLDRIDDRFDTSFFPFARIIEVELMNVEYFNGMLKKYSLFELSNALKPFVAEYFFETLAGVRSVIYLDSDILVTNSFAYVEKL